MLVRSRDCAGDNVHGLVGMGCLEAWFYYVVASCLKPNKNKLSVSCKIDLTCTLLFNFPFLAFTHFLNLPILSETWLRFVWFLLLQI